MVNQFGQLDNDYDGPEAVPAPPLASGQMKGAKQESSPTTPVKPARAPQMPDVPKPIKVDPVPVP